MFQGRSVSTKIGFLIHRDEQAEVKGAGDKKPGAYGVYARRFEERATEQFGRAVGDVKSLLSQIILKALMGIMLFSSCDSSTQPHSFENMKVGWAKVNDAETLLPLIPGFSDLASRFQIAYECSTDTQFEIIPPSDAGHQTSTETRREEVFLKEDGQRNWYLRYQINNLKTKESQMGEAMVKAGQFYRRLQDTPWIHRAKETGEQERLFSSQDQTQALLQLLKNVVAVSAPRTFELNGQPMIEFTLSKRAHVALTALPAAAALPHTEWRQQLLVDDLQGRIIFDAKTSVPMHIEFTTSFRGPRIKESEGNQKENVGEVKVKVSHQWDLYFPIDAVVINAPSSWQEAPVRNRSKPQDLLPSLTKMMHSSSKK